MDSGFGLLRAVHKVTRGGKCISVQLALPETLDRVEVGIPV